MRKILNYLLGEDLVNEQSDKQIKDTLMQLIGVWVFAAICFAVWWITA